MNGSSYVKRPLRNSANFSSQNDDKYCFIWSILAYLQPIAESRESHPKRVSNL